MAGAIRIKHKSNEAPENLQSLDFVHLRVHSAYSLLEGALPIKKIAELAIENKTPAVALTDTNNLFGALEFSEAMAEAGIQPITGVTIAIDFSDSLELNEKNGAINVAAADPHHDGLIALLACSEAGYQNLLKLVSAAHLSIAENDAPHVALEQCEEYAGGLIVLTGGPTGPIDRAMAQGETERAKDRLRKLHDLFDDRLYVELQRHGDQIEKRVEPKLIKLAYSQGLPLVATNQVFFAAQDDYEAHDALICVAEGSFVTDDNRRRMTPEHSFKSQKEMVALFSDLPEALENTIEIAKRCAFRPQGRFPILPRFVKTSANASDDELLAAEAAELKRQAEEGLAERLKTQPLAADTSRQDYEQRLAYELDVITRMKFPGYFLIVADFIKWAKSKDIPVGPGRGSGAGSLVAYSLTITDLDPLRFGLLFERFLNPERISMPDFDIDFCQDRRDEVIRYVQQKYGADRVAQIITHGKLQARAVLRDVGRVLQMPYGQVDKLCKLVPNNPANPVTLGEAIAGEPKLQEARKAEPVVDRLLEIGQKLEGLYRHASTHAAGIVIADRPLEELVPLYRDPKSNTPVTQFNWKMVEAAGLVKFDFLGLKTLTVLQKAVDLVKRCRDIDVDLASVPLDDPVTFKLLEKADTVGVFQLESTGMRDSLKRLRPDRFEDIIAMVALYRPGPMDNIPTYINRKHNEEPIDYLHPMLESILRETYGVIIYQEQVIQIAQVMGGYTLGQADMLRRAMGKKDKKEMARQRSRFVAGATEREVSRQDATYIFDLVNKFAGYGFNKSHAAAYALVSYHTAYMKANYHEEFLAASMTLDMANTDKLAMFADEARKSGITILPPCLNESESEFLPKPNIDAGKIPIGDAQSISTGGSIRYALSALKNIGTSAVDTIVSARNKGGAFKSLGDFAGRLNPRAVNKRAIETLAQAGAFDCLDQNRAAICQNADQIIAVAQRVEQNTAAGIGDLFGSGDGTPTVALRQTKLWNPLESLENEFRAVGFYLSGHPLDQYQTVLNKFGVKRYAEFEAHSDHGIVAGRLAAIVISARERRSQKGNKFAFAMFSDASGQFEAVIFSDTLAQSRDLLVAGKPVLLHVEGEREDDALKLRVQSMESLESAASRLDRGLRVKLRPIKAQSKAKPLREIEGHLARAKKDSGKPGNVILVLSVPELGKEVELRLPGSYNVTPTLAGDISTVAGVLAVEES